MKKKRILIALCIAVGIATGLAFKFQQTQGQKKRGQQPAQSIPDYEVYHQLFRHHVAMKKRRLILRSLVTTENFCAGIINEKQS
jgi:hypothetical protein